MELDYGRAEGDYVHLPCDVVWRPDSVVYPAVKDLVLASLQYRMGQQSRDGRWPLCWSFGGGEEMQELQRKYEVYYTLAILEKLDRFDRIAR